MKSVAQVDAVGEHGEGGGFEGEFFAAFFDVLRPAEGSSFQSFCDNPISSSIEVEDFDKGAFFIGEEEGCSAGRVDPELAAGELGETIEGFAHVARLKCDVDFEVAVEGEHGGIRRGF